MNQPELNGSPFKGRVQGLLYGVAFGDAIGAPVEKMSAAEIREKHGKLRTLDAERERNAPGRTRGYGIVTDDTMMTLCLMAVYNEARRHLDAWDMADGMVKQIAWTPRFIPEFQREDLLLERLFYPEKWIYQRLQLARCDPRQGGVGNVVNCGAAMYAAPIGVVNACNPDAAYAEAVAFFCGHQQSYGLEAAAVLAAAVAAAFQPGVGVPEIIGQASRLAKDGTRAAIETIAEAADDLRQKGAEYDEVVATFHAKIAPYSTIGDHMHPTVEQVGIPTSNYQPSRLLSIEELPLALGFALLADGAFRPAIEDGINSGRDTDSIGVMIGAILGAMHGESVIEPRLAQQINEINRFDLKKEAETFAQTAQGIIQGDHDRLEKIAQARVAIGLEGKRVV